MSEKIFLIAAGCIIMLLGCSYQVVEPEISISVPAENTYTGIIRLGEVRELRVPDAVEGSRHHESGCEIEYPTHKPDYHKFMANYNPAEEFLTLQFHPTSWDQQQFAAFRKIVLHLYRQGALFKTPTEFGLAFYPELMEPSALL